MATSSEREGTDVLRKRSLIFVTVGSQLPFDRMIRAIDEWSATHRSYRVVAQIGDTDFKPQNIEYTNLLTAEEFEEEIRQATVVIAHAGMGTILTALEIGVPILVVPRRANLGETRTDHQLATVKYLGSSGFVSVAMDEQELVERLNSLNSLSAPSNISNTAIVSLLTELRNFVQSVAANSTPKCS